MKFQKTIIVLITTLLLINTAGIIYIAREEKAQSQMTYWNTMLQIDKEVGLGKASAEEKYADMTAKYFRRYSEYKEP